MTKGPTLADMAIRESLRPHQRAMPASVGERIAKARKFVLDEQASKFLCDLSHASYAEYLDLGKTDEEVRENSTTITERMRVLSRLPHASTWIEYDSKAFRLRTLEAYNEKVGHINASIDPLTGRVIAKRGFGPGATEIENIVPNVGWLLETINENCFTMTMVVGGVADAEPLTLPCMFAWTTDDSVPPIKTALASFNEGQAGYLATGIHGYKTPHVVIGSVKEMGFVSTSAASMVLAEWMSELRFVWSLLSTINDIPVGIKQVIPSKGFIARGKYRRFVEHSIISILIPKQRDPRVVAKQVVIAARRRAHMVRGHWRRNWRSEEGKIWVREHQRGDASLGFVLHDYKIEHHEEKDDEGKQRSESDQELSNR